MPSKILRRLVIDASVAHASGDKIAVNPTSKHCRDFLLATLKIGHQAVMTLQMREEWDKHQSRFARLWRQSMIARRKLCIIDVAMNDKLRVEVGCAASKNKYREIMLKDMHLIEAAIATDRVIISLDEEVRILFREAARKVGELRIVIWANPDKPKEDCIAWLVGGAKVEKKRQLGFIE